MNRIGSKALHILQNQMARLLVVAAICLTVAVAVHGTVTAQITDSYDRINPGTSTPMSQRLLLAFAGDTDDLADKLGTFPVDVKTDNFNEIVVVKDGDTVYDALYVAGIIMGEHDTVSPPMEQVLTESDRIVVTRRERVLYTEEKEVPFQVHYVYSPEVRAGEEVVEVEGRSGVSVFTYEQLLVRGDVDEERLVDEQVVEEPVHKRVLMGFKSKPVSTFDFEATFDENGEPIGYASVHRSQRATAYTATGASTASGRPAQVGHVAVNPNVIPYGSKLFIQSTDGNFIYGYAIAADTGSALMSGAVGVDLFFNTYAECATNGVRDVNIFVLD